MLSEIIQRIRTSMRRSRELEQARMLESSADSAEERALNSTSDYTATKYERSAAEFRRQAEEIKAR